MKRCSEAVQLFKEWEAHWLEYSYGYWTVARSDTSGTVIGFGGIMKKRITPELFDNNLYFRFRPQAWEQSYASELAEAALECAFNAWGQGHVIGYTREHNTASRKTLERAGFKLVGTINDVAGEAPSLLYRIEHANFAQRKRVQNA